MKVKTFHLLDSFSFVLLSIDVSINLQCFTSKILSVKKNKLWLVLPLFQCLSGGERDLKMLFSASRVLGQNDIDQNDLRGIIKFSH